MSRVDFNNFVPVCLCHSVPFANWLCFFKLVSILLTILPLFIVLSAPSGIFSHILLIDKYLCFGGHEEPHQIDYPQDALGICD